MVPVGVVGDALGEGGEEDECHKTDEGDVEFGFSELFDLLVASEGEDDVTDFLGDEAVRDIEVFADLGVEDEFFGVLVGNVLFETG